MFSSIKKVKKEQYTLICFLVLSLLLVGFLLKLYFSAPLVVRIEADGFHPSRIEIEKGQTLTFISKINEDTWPASDPHPTHSDYPEFDPKKPLKSGETWNFTFDKPGVWGYHDHLHVSFSGVVVVRDSVSEKSDISADCAKFDVNGGSACFDEKLREAVRTKGVSAAFALLGKEYDTGDVLAACHWSAHKIGDEAYQQEKLGKPLELIPETYYCGYGFYHGYLEAMLREDPNPQKQKEKVTLFCDTAQKQLGGEARDNCYHGIGSGFTGNPPDPLTWGKPELVVEPGLKICAQLFGDTREWEMCTTGVYAVLANFMSDNKYNFSMDPKDPLQFCASQDERLHRACYGEFAPKLIKFIGPDLSKIAPYVKNIEDKEIAKLVVNVNAISVMQNEVLKNDDATLISGCRALPQFLQPTCFDGIVWGFLYHGRINEEHVRTMAFCDSNMFSSNERDFCYQRIVARAKNMYSSTKFAGICQAIDEKYRHYCNENLPVRL